MKNYVASISASLLLFGCAASSDRGQFANEDGLRDEDIEMASAALEEVRNFYRIPNESHSCKPGPDSTTDKNLIEKVLHPAGYTIDIAVLERWFLNIIFIRPSDNDLIGVSIKWENGKCVQFEIEQGSSGW